MTFCPYCGNKVQANQDKCSKCGEALGPGNAADPRGSTLMGVSSVKNDADTNAPKLQGVGGSSVVVEQGMNRVATPTKLAKASDPSDGAPTTESPRAATPVPKPGDTKPMNAWDKGDLNSSGVGMMPAGDSLMLRAGDIIDPVTGLPIRAFKAKPKSKLPIVAGGLLLAGFGGLMYYISSRPAPLIKLTVAEQVASGEGGPYRVEIEVKDSKIEAVKVKGVEAKPEEQKAKVELSDDAVPVGKVSLPLELKIQGEWREAAPLELTRPARPKVAVDKATEILKFDFDVMEGGKEITILTSKAKVEGGKAHLEMPFRSMVGPAEQGLTQINKEAVYQVEGIDGDFSFTFSFPAPKPPFVLKSPADYLIVDKKADKVPLEFDVAADIKITVTVNGAPLAADKDGKYIAPLKPDDNVAVIKAEGKDVAPIEVTRHIFRGVPPAGWNKSEAKPNENKTP